MEENEIHLRDYVRIVMKRRYTVYAFFIIVFLVVLIGTFSTKPVYVASTKVLIEKVEPASLVTSAPYIPYDPDFYETQYQLIKSVAVGRKVVDMLNLEKTYGSFFRDDSGSSVLGGALKLIKGAYASLFGQGKSEKPRLTDEEREARADAIAKAISGGIVVKPVKNSKIVDIGFYSGNPAFAKAVSDTVAKAYIEELLDLNMSATRFMVQWMKQKAEEEKDKLEKSEKALQEYVKARNFVTVENKIAIIPQQISELNGQLIRAETKKKEMEVLYQKVKDASRSNAAETVTVISSDPGLQALRQQIMKAEQNVMELSQKYGKKHPSLIRATEELNGLNARKEQEIKRIIESIKNEYELARSNEGNLRKMLAQTKDEALDLNEKFGEYTVLNREVETNRQMYDALIKRIKEQSVTEQVRTVNVLIVEKAELPKSPVKPKKGMNIFIGIFVGLLGGIGIAFFVEYLDNTVKSPEDAETKLDAPVFGMVPLLLSNEHPVEDIVLSEPKSNFAESYKAIRAAILLSSAEKPPKRILITSAGPGEGKTTTAVNLALAIALSENKVLLIDADLRKPRIHKIFGLGNAKGLSTYLSGASDMRVIQEGPIPNLRIITSGPVPPNPSELLSSNRVAEMIGELSERYDIIIIDSPPLLTVADSLILSKIPDGTILVTRAGKTTYDLARRGLKSLANLDAHVLGVVINGIDVKKGDYYYYRYHNYYYSSEETDT